MKYWPTCAGSPPSLPTGMAPTQATVQPALTAQGPRRRSESCAQKKKKKNHVTGLRAKKWVNPLGPSRNDLSNTNVYGVCVRTWYWDNILLHQAFSYVPLRRIEFSWTPTSNMVFARSDVWMNTLESKLISLTIMVPRSVSSEDIC